MPYIKYCLEILLIDSNSCHSSLNSRAAWYCEYPAAFAISLDVMGSCSRVFIYACIFDGYMDVSLWKWVGGTSNNVPHYYWPWDNDAYKFVADEGLERISDSSALEIDKENKRLISSSRDGAWMNQTDYYEYRDGKIELAKRAERYFGLEHREDHGADFAGLARIIISESVDGELTVTQEYYIDSGSAGIYDDPPK